MKDKNIEKNIELALEKIMIHPLFMESMGALLNFNSMRRIWLRQSLQRLWRTLELPLQHDQEKTLFLVTELQFKIMKLERELLELRKNQNKRPREVTPKMSQIRFEKSAAQKQFQKPRLKA